MRRLQFLGLCLAVVAFGVRAENVAEEVEVDHVEVLEELSDDERINLGKMFGELFEIDENEDVPHTADAVEGSNREDRARDVGTEKTKSDPKDLSRFNNFIDTFFRRLNSYSRTRFDPLGFAIAKKSGSGKAKNKKAGKGDKEKKDKKKGNKKGNKKAQKKSSRHPKDLSLDEEEEVENREKREVELVALDIAEEEVAFENEEEEEDSLERTKRDTMEEPAEEEEAVARKGRPAGGAKKGNKNKSAKKNSKSKKGKKGKKKGGKKKSGKKGGNKKGRKSPKARTTRAFVTGLGTLVRNGDVLVRDSENSKLIKADFLMGPVDLKVSRKYGDGKDAVVRNARATSPQLEGKITIKLSPKGRAKVSAFTVKKPAIVKVDGSLSKSERDSSNNNFLENSIGKFAPYAAQKLKLAGRAVLKDAEPKGQE
ncbi:uncharacterized protein LOC125033405 [Penaeus chinensis]|uniref:uncharacterized protein LOC125033405 n=1 Tax=Penaeus chinensis TaxID=139456 RepID=UPI001FB78D11|nr:uncharacterized protein LOC125033405 [Penaeus chinensis]